MCLCIKVFPEIIIAHGRLVAKRNSLINLNLISECVPIAKG